MIVDTWWRQPASLARACPLSLGHPSICSILPVCRHRVGAPGSLWLGWSIVEDSYLFSSDYVGPAQYLQLSKMLSSGEKGEKNRVLSATLKNSRSSELEGVISG